MAFKHMVLSTAAVSGVLLGITAFAPPQFSLATLAHAESNISVNFGFGNFYDRLEPYGSWVSFEDQYVFVPTRVDRGWRPYTLGHWSYTNRYGWLWVSTERFGWATYHYGRWGHSRDIGWYWVPGHKWAPAWVAWSHGRNEIAWAPLPPRRGNNVDVDITISVGDVPDYYWQAVPTSAFLSINLSDKVIRDRSQVRTIVQQNAPETVRIENNIVINNVIQVNEIETATNTKVVVLQEKAVTTPDAAGKIDANSVAIFNPEVKVDAAAKPKKTVKVEEVVTERKAKGIQADDMVSDQPAAVTPTLDKNGKPIAPAEQPAAASPAVDKNGKAIPPAEQPVTTAPTVDKNGKPVTASEQPADTAKAPETPKDAKPAVVVPPVTEAPAAEAPVVKTKKDKAAPADTTKATKDVPVDQAQKGKVTSEPVAPQETPQVKDPKKVEQQPADEQQTKKKKKDGATGDQQPADQKAAAPVDEQTPPADTNAKAKPAKKGAPADKCDPNTETCPPAQ